MFHDTLGKPINKFASYAAKSPKENDVFFQTIKRFVEHKILFPLSFYDGNYFDEPVPSRFVGIWYADELSEIEKLEQELS